MKKYPKSIIALLSLFILTIFVSFLTAPNTSISKTGSPNFSVNNKKVGVIELYGPIAFASSSAVFTKIGAESVLHQIEAMQKDKSIEALILRINSPGGTVGASQEIFTRLLRFKQKRDIPVIASIGDIGASGAYYAALSADTIFANPGSLVGSIGVIMGNINFTDFINKHGVRFDIYKSGQYKDSLSSWRNPSEREEKLLQTLVNNVHKQFETAVITHRKLNQSQASQLAQGQVFTGMQAQENKLVDELGSYEDALYFTARLLGSDKRPEIISKATPSFSEIFSFWEEQMGNSFSNLLFKSPFLNLQ